MEYERVMVTGLWRFFLPLFKLDKRTNYSIFSSTGGRKPS